MPKKTNDNNNKKNPKEKGLLKKQKTLKRKDTIRPKDYTTLHFLAFPIKNV